MTAVEAFLRDPDHLASDDGSVHGAPTNRPELYQLAALRRRLLPVLAQLRPDDFELVARDRNLMILASPTPRVSLLTNTRGALLACPEVAAAISALVKQLGLE